MITGMSGAGRSEAADHLEDLGWFVIDNLPPTLIPKVVELAAQPSSSLNRIALVVGTGPYHADVLPALTGLQAQGSRVRILYLEASTDALVRRYETTRRRHPLLAGGSLREAIEAERELLGSVRAEAGLVVDTTSLHVHQLRDRIVELFSDEDDEVMQVTVTSFGYKHGLPLDVDMVLDCRFLPNPHWVEELRPLSGLDPEVRDYVLAQPEAQGFVERLRSLLELLVPAFTAEGKAYLTVAMGCTGGQHRSVVMAEQVASIVRALGHEPTIIHRDLSRSVAAEQ